MFDLFFTELELEEYLGTLDRDQEKLLRFNNLVRDQGVWKNNAKYYVSTVHGDLEIEQTINAWRTAIQEL